MRRSSLLISLFTLSIALNFMPAHAAGWTADATVLDLTAGPGRTAAFLAPDGSRFAYLKNDELCLYSLAGEKGDCIGLEDDISIDAETVRWSPDSTKLAFSEDFLITLRDSDIWLYDIETNTLTDLTSAPNREMNILVNRDADIVFTVDMIPQWAVDSQSLYFIRYSFNRPKDARAAFYRVSVDGGQPEAVAPVDTVSAISTYSFALSPDNTQIVYNLDTLGKEKDGTWFLDMATGKAKFAAAPVQQTAPWSYQYSPEGDLVLTVGVAMDAMRQYQQPELSPVYTLPVFGGRQQSLNIDNYVFAAGWGLNGSTLAYTTYNPENEIEQGLYITDAPRKAGDMVLPGNFIAPTPQSRTPLFWAANDTLLLSQAPDFKLVVVKLSQS